jgi:hypothetical protein
MRERIGTYRALVGKSEESSALERPSIDGRIILKKDIDGEDSGDCNENNSGKFHSDHCRRLCDKWVEPRYKLKQLYQLFLLFRNTDLTKPATFVAPRSKETYKQKKKLHVSQDVLPEEHVSPLLMTHMCHILPTTFLFRNKQI